MITRIAALTTTVALSTVPLAETQQVGPASGALVIVGGGQLDSTITLRFLALAGGRSARIVVIPTAGGNSSYDEDCCRGLFERVGATNVTVLHTYSRDTANMDAFVAPLRQANGVWFAGGRQWRLADAYLHTRVHDELWNLLQRGGVIGGSSAGATIQGSYLARGDTHGNEVMMGDHEEGMAFLKHTAIDQHLLRRNRQFDLIEIVTARPELLGIGIDENTAIVVTGDEFEVIGQGYVAIYDVRRQIDSGGLFYFLAPGQFFDLRKREGYSLNRSGQRQPLGRVVERRWP